MLTTMQDAVECQYVLVRQSSQKIIFERLYTRVLEDSQGLASSPTLSHYTRIPRRLDSGIANHRFENPKFFFSNSTTKPLI